MWLLFVGAILEYHMKRKLRKYLRGLTMENKTYYTIDVLHVVRTLVQRWWLIVLSGILAGVLGFFISAFAVAPTYSSSIMLYVNNSSFSIGNTSLSITSSEITAAKSLVNTYSEILDNRTTLERVIEKAQVSYTYEELAEMIEAKPSNDTEIMIVIVTTTDPYVSAKIANCIAEVLPIRISEIIDGASMEVVDSAIPELEKVAPDITQYTIIGAVLGVLFSVLAIMVIALVDDTIHTEEFVLSNYELPILAKVPDLVNVQNKKYGYRYEKKKYGK